MKTPRAKSLQGMLYSRSGIIYAKDVVVTFNIPDQEYFD
jgi:hypothetical protein